MLVQAETLKNLPVASLEDEARIGSVVDIVLHPETGELVGFWVQPDRWFAAKRALSSRDIVSYDPQAVVVRSSDALVAPSEIQPFAMAAATNAHWIGKRAEDETGQHLGRVSDLVVDIDLEMLRKVEVSSLLGPRRLISREDIVRVTPKALIVRADSQRPVSTEAVVESVAS